MATGGNELKNENENSVFECEGLNSEESLINDGSTAGSVYLGSDDNDDDDDDGVILDETTSSIDMENNLSEKKPKRQFQRTIRMNNDIIKFISKRKKYSQELDMQLHKLFAVVLLMPKESLIKVTKKPGSKFVKDWSKRCCSTVRRFCARFGKECFELRESSSVRERLPKLGGMLQSTTAAYWMEANDTRLAVMTEQSERNQVLTKVREFLQNTGNYDGFQEHKKKRRSDRIDWRKPTESNATRNTVIVGETNSFNILNDEASFQQDGKPSGKESTLKNLQRSVKTDNDITKFLMKRKKHSDELKRQLSPFGVDFQLKPGIINIKKVDSGVAENWEKRCQDIVTHFCSSFKKRSFTLDEGTRESILEALPTLQKSISYTGAACWFDTQKQNLTLISLEIEFSNAVKEVEEFIQKAGIFARKCFKIEKSIQTLVNEDLPTLKEVLKSCNIKLEEETLVVVCLRTESENVVKKVENFLQKLQNIKQADVANKVERPRIRSLLSIPFHSTTDEDDNASFLNWRNKNEPESMTSREDTRHRPVKREPVSVKINNDVVKFVMNNPIFSQELTEQLEKQNGEVQWKPGIPFVTVVQKSEYVFVPKWSETCKSLVTKFFQRFRKQSYTIQEDIQESVCKGLKRLKETICLSGADCWVASNNRWLVLVGLKDNLPSIVKAVEGFLQEVKEENEKLKEIVKFVEVSTDHIDYLEHTQFLNTLKQNHSALAEVKFTKSRDQICFVGSDEDVSAAKQQYEALVKELNIIELELPTEAMKFVSQDKGMDFIEKCLSEREIVSVILVESKSSVKVVARSLQECEAVKECLCSNVREATIILPPTNEHMFTSKKWYDISKTIDSEELVDYQISFEGETKRDIKLHGATPLVEKHEKIVADFISSQKIETNVKRLLPGIARFMKEKLGKELEQIESDLKEEHVKIEIGLGKFQCTGTNEGINESTRRIMDLRSDIQTRSLDYCSIGVDKLFSSEEGQRNIKGIEAKCNVKLEVVNGFVGVKEESTQVDVEAIRAQREKGKREIKPATPVDPFDQCNFTTIEGLKVSWKYGNIAHERADILVSSAVSNLNHPTMVGQVLNSVGGSLYMAACSQHTNIGTGDIATTIGGNLACNYVIHAVCCGWNAGGTAEQTLRSLLIKILMDCNRHSARSVAMPLIGTGKHRFPEDVVLRVMKEEFEKFSSRYSHGTLKEITLVRYDQGISRKTVQATSDSITRTSKPTFVPLVASSSFEGVKLHVYARSSDAITSAIAEIERFIKTNIALKKFEHQKLFDVVLKYWDELKSLAKNANLRITYANETTVSIEGLLSNVLEANNKLAEMVSRHTEEERKSHQLNYISQNVQWYYFDNMSREIAYSVHLNGTIEVARMNGEAMVEITEPDGQQFHVDFDKMVARSKSTGQTRKLSRKQIGSETGSESSLPSTWTPQAAGKVVELVRVLPTSSEYLSVHSHFVARGGRADQLYSVERIQNPQLYSRYLAFKKSMRGQTNEMRLFHGTDAANVDSINAHNFSRSFAGVNGVAYGNGVYFARDASYSIKYARKGHFGLTPRPKMYMAKVLVGEFTKGASGMKAPPSKNDPNNPGLRYDSVVDHPSNPSMYIIFQDNQYYPEYLLTLQ